MGPNEDQDGRHLGRPKSNARSPTRSTRELWMMPSWAWRMLKAVITAVWRDVDQLEVHGARSEESMSEHLRPAC